MRSTSTPPRPLPAARRLFTATATAAVLAALLHVGSAPAAPEPAFQAAFQAFNAASSGKADEVDKAVSAFDNLLKAEPGNPVLMVYAGAATSMRATTTMLPWKKMSYAEDGMAAQDKALAMLTPAHDAVVQHNTPGSLEVRFVAANTFLAVPGFMNRGARGAKLLAEVLGSPLLASAPLGFQGSVWMRAAKLAISEKRTDDARNYLNLIVKANAPQAAAAREQLKALAS